MMWLSALIEPALYAATSEKSKQFHRPQLEVAFRASPLRLVTWVIAQEDGQFALPRPVIENMVQQVAIHRTLRYEPERRNCSDFAELLRYAIWMRFGWRGIGYVIDYSGKHCYNVALSYEGDTPEFLLIEPQSGRFVEPGAEWRPGETYKLERAFLIL